MIQNDYVSRSYGSEANHLHVQLYHLDEKRWRFRSGAWSLSPTIRGRYRDTWLKGNWCWGSYGGLYTYLEAALVVGGEDNMVQVETTVPWVGSWSIGVRVPRSWTRRWVYERRTILGVKVGWVGNLLDLAILEEENARSGGLTTDYFKRQREDPPPWRAGRPPAPRLTDLMGWHVRVRTNLRNRILGRQVYSCEEGEWRDVLIPMPEGGYPARACETTSTWVRPRWPFSRKVVHGHEIDLHEHPIPHPGKGENSYDLDDDAWYSSSGPGPIEKGIGHLVESTLRRRQQYGGQNWVPDEGWKVPTA